MTQRAHDTIVFRIPAAFILARALPSASELAYGVRHGWLAPPDTAALTAARRAAGAVITDSEESLARVAFARATEIEQALRVLTAGPAAAANDRLWLYLAITWILSNRDGFQDPYDALERLYADFGYPKDLEGIVRFMPAPPGAELGLQAIDRRWRETVDRLATEFRSRPVT